MIFLSSVQWRLGYDCEGSLKRLFHACLGYCLHSNTDNVAYDASIKSQLAWSEELQTFSDCHYFSVVGHAQKDSAASAPPQPTISAMISEVLSSVTAPIRYLVTSGPNSTHDLPEILCGLSTGRWACAGGDGLLDAHTQEYPKLSSRHRHPSRSYHHAYHHKHCKAKRTDNKTSESTAVPEVGRGCWHYLYREVHHLSASFADTATWACLWDLVHIAQLQQPHKVLAAAPLDSFRLPAKQLPSGDHSCESASVDSTASLSAQSSCSSLHSHGSSSTARHHGADMQRVALSLDSRHRVTYSRHSRIVFVFAALVGTLCWQLRAREAKNSEKESLRTDYAVIVGAVSALFVPTFHWLCNSAHHTVSSDAVEVLFAVNRFVALGALTEVTTALQLQSFLFLLEALALTLLAHKGRGGVYDYTLTMTKVVLGVLIAYDSSVVSCSLVCVVSALLLVSKSAWALLGLQRDWQLSVHTVYPLFMCLWATLLTLCGVCLVEWYAIRSGRYILLAVLCSVALSKTQDLSAAFQYLMIADQCHCT